MLDKVISNQKPGRLLDLGCGQGSLLLRFKDYHSCFGCEFDSRARSHAISNGLNNIEFIDLNSANTLPFEGMFDIIVCSEVCEHLLNPRNAVRLVRSSISSNGIFILTVPNAVPMMTRLKSLFGKNSDWLHYPSADTEQTGHIRFYTVNSLRKLLGEEGFKVDLLTGVSWRMNGKIWSRLYYWISRILRKDPALFGRKIDSLLSNLFPGLSPGLFLIARPCHI
ncbi:MAG: class I SAM-dependent methyltransferase [Blastochloris sp.]|nr:class I SAM-dependent methyltransferase [Blastochloris sp.]